MNFQVGDEVMYIGENEYFGIRGKVISINEKFVTVTYGCEKSRKLWIEKFRTYSEYPRHLRKFSKLEKVLK